MHARIRVANLLLLFAALLFLLGGTALVFASGMMGWSDLADAFGYLVSGRWPALVALAVLAVGLTVALLVQVFRAIAVAGRSVAAEPEARRILPDGAQLVNQVRRKLDLEICRGRPDVDRVVDVLLCTPLDVDVPALSLSPGEMLVEIALEQPDQQHPVTSLPPPLYAAVLARLREMAGIGETGDGLLDLRSSRRAEQILVRLKRGRHGVETRIQVVSEEDAPLRRRRSNAVVFRIERPTPIKDMITGEFPVPLIDEHEATDPGSGVLVGFGPSGEHEVAPLVGRTPPRQVGPAEEWLRLVLGGVLVVSAVVLFWDAFGWGLARTRGSSLAPWRNVSIHVISSPDGGEVSIGGSAKGRTPLTVAEPCRGRAISVLVRVEGHKVWQWTGICPGSGQLRLAARLQPK